MKRVLATFILILMFLCGCKNDSKLQNSSQNIGINQLKIDTFSYSSDYNYYKDDVGAKKSGFNNTEKSMINNTEDIVNLAKLECTVKYDTINITFDADSKIYKVCFSKKGYTGGDQAVYINQDGITQFIVYGE